jgi:hypothetical protein
MSILVTFSCSILLICALQHLKEALGTGAILWGVVFAVAVVGVYLLNTVLEIDYGFWGCMAPVFPAVFQDRRGAERKCFPKLDRREIHVGMLALGLVILWLDLGGDQLWSLLAIPVLLLYSGRRGKLPMKYFFYVFYPVHLALLQLIGWIVY